ncbi:phosphonate ABC transporter ATP-binding protein [Magnetospirillum sp. UT-4]|uniref:phosphonate ABC transporter ATP-binding protein n=1 Tax=Magnetospirillum sp. UT-4 TaxID=2681467 RepID=UPI00137F09DA|nr:phosphonate ABC transporter ATP-binding protein [Magnetospirillum sp. UT-4]CAA7626434.1 phosphonate/organophosphate ester transporter subunit; ATP-binding component of ABC superfamily [Magnetospirillum sp. UT-4]
MDAAVSVVEPAIKVTRLSKSFICCKALDEVSLEIRPGEMVALIGASGSGKSTLLRHVTGLTLGDRDLGSIEVLGKPVQSCGRPSRHIRAIRARVGFVFQQFNLVGRLPVMTNVLTGTLGRMPLWRSLTGAFPEADRRLALDALDRVGIADKAWERASALSGGQQQRAAIARTLVQKAEIILADEPIASLDPESSRRVMESLARINAEDKVTVVVSLHQVDFAIRFCPRTVALKAGRVVYDGPSAALTPQLLRDLYGSEVDELDGIEGVQGSASFVTGIHTSHAAALAG